MTDAPREPTAEKRADPHGQNVLDRTWMRRLILLDLVLIALLGWLLWSVYKGGKDEDTEPKQPSVKVPYQEPEPVEGLEY